MFQLPSIPTENLYKFLALGSIVVFISTILWCQSEFVSVATDRAKFNTSIKLHRLHLHQYAVELGRLKKDFEKDSMNLSVYNGLIGKGYDSLRIKYNKSIRVQCNLVNKSRENRLALDESHLLLHNNITYWKLILTSSIFLIVTSLIVGYWGFLKWYKIQLLSDELIKAQLEKAKKESMS